MKTYKQTLLGRLIPSTFYFLILLLTGCATNREIIVNSFEEIIIYTKKGPVTATVLLDTGAGGLSIDAAFVEEHGLEPYVEDTKSKVCSYGQKYVGSANGGQCRDRVILSFSLKGNLHVHPATVSDRSNMKTVALIGRLATSDKYLIRPTPNSTTQDDIESEEEEKKD